MQQRLYALAEPSSASYLALDKGSSPLCSPGGRSKSGLSVMEVLSSELEWVLIFFSLPNPSHNIYSDASGTSGCGVVVDSLGYLQHGDGKK